METNHNPGLLDDAINDPVRVTPHSEFMSPGGCERIVSGNSPSAGCMPNDVSRETDNSPGHHNAEVYIEMSETRGTTDAHSQGQQNMSSQLREPIEHPKGALRIHRPINDSVCHKCGGRIIRVSRSLSLGVLPEETPVHVDGGSSVPATPLKTISPPHTPVHINETIGLDSQELICHCVKRKVSVSEIV
jgi:hypothetical protein